MNFFIRPQHPFQIEKMHSFFEIPIHFVSHVDIDDLITLNSLGQMTH